MDLQQLASLAASASMWIVSSAIAVAPSLIGTLVGATLAFQLGGRLARQTARRQWRTDRLSGFVRRSYGLVPGFERAVGEIARGEPDRARDILKELATLTQEVGYARAADEDLEFRAAAEAVIRQKVTVNDLLEGCIRQPPPPGNTIRDSNIPSNIAELHRLVLALDRAAERYLFDR